MLQWLAALLLAGGVGAADFVSSHIVPDVVDVPPVCNLSVVYGDGAAVNNGNQLSVLSTLLPPSVAIPVDPGVNKTLIFISANTSTGSLACPPRTQFLLWLVVNISGGDVSSGYTAAAYAPPIKVPPLVSGGDRCVFLLFTQTRLIEIQSLNYLIRNCFDTRSFIKTQNLKEQYCGNFFTTSGVV